MARSRITLRRNSNGARTPSPIALPTDCQKQPKRPVGRLHKMVLRTARRALPVKAYVATRATYRPARLIALSDVATGGRRAARLGRGGGAGGRGAPAAGAREGRS